MNKLRSSILLNAILLAVIAWLSLAPRLRAKPESENATAPQAALPAATTPAPSPESHIEAELEDFTYRYKTDSFANRPMTAGGIVMLGDSLTDLGAWSEFFPGTMIINRGISGDNTYGVLNRLDQVIALKPKKIFLLVGTNDLFWNGTVADTASRYKKILGTLKTALPGTTLYVQSVFPFNRLPKGDYGYLDNTKASELNALIKNLAADAGAHYLDLWPVLSDSSGQLDARYTTDGIHLNGQGYLQWLKAITPSVMDQNRQRKPG